MNELYKTCCCSDICERKNDCANHYLNNKGICHIEDFYNAALIIGSFNLETGKCTTDKEYYSCGEKGKWGMFESVESEE